jgi:hypothetical protein
MFFLVSALALPLPLVRKHTQNGYLLFLALILSSPCVDEKGFSYISYIAGVRVSPFKGHHKKFIFFTFSCFREKSRFFCVPQFKWTSTIPDVIFEVSDRAVQGLPVYGAERGGLSCALLLHLREHGGRQRSLYSW